MAVPDWTIAARGSNDVGITNGGRCGTLHLSYNARRSNLLPWWLADVKLLYVTLPDVPLLDVALLDVALLDRP